MQLDTVLAQFTTKYITIYGIACQPVTGEDNDSADVLLLHQLAQSY
jgi:hypothetical protein